MRDSAPRLPRRATRGPHLVEMVLVAQRIHRLPEAAVEMRRKRTLSCQTLQRLALPHGGIAFYVIENRRRQDEETAVDPAAIALGLFLKAGDEPVFQHKRTKAARRLHRGERRLDLPRAVVRDQLGHVDVGDAVAIREAELLIPD